MKEIFKTVPGWDKYEVSNLGRLKRKSSKDTIGRFWPAHFKILKKGYYTKITDKPRSWEGPIARLILIAFVGKTPRHNSHARNLDDDRTNNKLTNLAWGSAWDNAQDKIRNGGTTKGRPRPLSVRIKIGLAQKGKIISDEQREKIRQAKLGVRLTKEHRANISKALKGKPR